MTIESRPASYKSDTEKIIGAYNSLKANTVMAPLPREDFLQLVQLGSEDEDLYYEPYLVLPRLAEMDDWLIYPTINTNTFLYKRDNLVKLFIKLFSSMVIGDGMNVSIYQDELLREIDEKYTDIAERWLTTPTGASSHNKGNTINSWVIPRLIRDSFLAGKSAWFKIIGYRPLFQEKDIGKLMIKWMDPRTYVKVHHKLYDYVKLVQFPIIRHDEPKTKEEFDKWDPTIRSRFQNLSSYPGAVEREKVHIPAEQFYWFNLFDEPPMDGVSQSVMSKMTLMFFRDRFIEKATFPFFIVKVPRDHIRDASDAKFMEKLESISKLIGQLRAGDVIAIEGEEYSYSGTERIQLSEGWEIQILEIKSGSIDFETHFRQLNDEIANGLLSSMAMISSIGVQGRTTTLSTGGQINANILQIIKNARKIVAEVFRFIIQDVIELETGDVVDPRLIDISFSKIREEDAAQFLNQLISLYNIGAMTTNEVRANTDRIGLPLKPLPPEMTAEGRALFGLEELLQEEAFEFPSSWTTPEGPEIKMEEEMKELGNKDNFSKRLHEAVLRSQQQSGLVRAFEALCDTLPEDKFEDLVIKAFGGKEKENDESK